MKHFFNQNNLGLLNFVSIKRVDLKLQMFPQKGTISGFSGEKKLFR